MKEHNNRIIANKYAEYITGQALRKYLAAKVRHYVGDNPIVFDSAVGSGQLEQYLNAKYIYGVEIQEPACKAFKENYPSSTVYHQSFFEFDEAIEADCVVMNPPFSIKFKDLSEAERANIQASFPWKKSGVVDDIFVLKSMKYARFGFYILFAGVAYRNTEKKFRELIGNKLVECNTIAGGFDDTAINVLFLVVDNDKTSAEVYQEYYDCKTDKIINSHTVSIDPDHWQLIKEPVQEETIDIDAVECNLTEQMIESFETSMRLQYLMITSFAAKTDLKRYISHVKQVCNHYEVLLDNAEI